MNTFRNSTSLVALGASIAFMADTEGAAGAAGVTVDESTPVDDNPAIVPLMDETKIDNIKKLMKSRQVFVNRVETVIDNPDGTKTTVPAMTGFEQARALLAKVLGATEQAYGLPIAVKGLDAETGEIDTTIYDDALTVVAYVGAKADKITGIKGIVVFPMPTLDQFLESDGGKDWIAKTIEKEGALVAFRNFRESATVNDFQAGVSKSPATVSEYVTEYQRGGTGLDTDTFDALWNDIRKAIKAKSPELSKALPGKPEIVKAIRSKAYATAEFPKMEAAGIFVTLAQAVMDTAANNTTMNEAKEEIPAPLDVTAIQSWLAGRDTLVIEKPTTPEVTDELLASFKL